MSDTLYTQTGYSLATTNKADNEALIAEIYSLYPSMTMGDKLDAMMIVSALKDINDEYDKYIIVYQRRTTPRKTRDNYTTRDGDTLLFIATKFFGDHNRWIDIYNFNNLSDVNLSVGQSIAIPET